MEDLFVKYFFDQERKDFNGPIYRDPHQKLLHVDNNSAAVFQFQDIQLLSFSIYCMLFFTIIYFSF